jgi:hypothetical protein
MRIMTLTAAMTLLTLSSAAHAEMSANEMLAKIDAGGDQATLVTLWLSGNANGISWVNVELKDGKAAVYCPPGKLAITPEQDVDILRRFVRDHPKYGGAPAGLAMFEALKFTFPCNPGGS